MRTFSLILATLAMAAFSSTSAVAETWTKQCINGGPNGYYKVVETHNNPFIGQSTHSLECADPGITNCEWGLGSGPHPRIIGYAEGQIGAGVLSGQFSTVIDGIHCTVSWHATGSDNYTITEVQNASLQ